MQAAIDATDIASGGTAAVAVYNPTPGGGVSGSVSFTVQFSSPSIGLLSLSSAIAGGAAFTVTVTGAYFLPSSSVQWNGSARPTTFVSSTNLQASITATDISAIGTAKITVANPAANGGTSNASTFLVGSSGGSNFAVIVLNQLAQDIAFDSINNVFYLSVPGSSATNPNTISVLDPSDGTITLSVPAGTTPNVLAISDDSQFLYAGIGAQDAVLGCQVFIAQEQFLIDSSGDVCQQTWPVHFDARASLFILESGRPRFMRPGLVEGSGPFQQLRVF